MDIPPRAILETKVLATVLDSEVVYHVQGLDWDLLRSGSSMLAV